MSPREVLEAARERIADPIRHTRRVAARTAGGTPCAAKSERACSWCVLGAIASVEGSTEAKVAAEVFLHRALPAGFCAIDAFNDAAEHADIIAAFDRAIDLARAEERS